MRLDVSKALRAPGASFPFQVTGEIPPQDILGETVVFSGVSLEGVYTAAEEIVSCRGTLHAEATARCARCLSPAKVAIDAPFDEIFERAVTPKDPDHFSFEGSALDLFPLALTVAVLALPIRFLCREGCAGEALQAPQVSDPRACPPDAPAEKSDANPFEALQHMFSKDEEV